QSQRFLRNISFDIRKTKIPTLMAVCQSLMIETKTVQDCCVEIVDAGLVLDNAEAKFVGLANNLSPFEAATCYPHRECETMVIAALAGLFLGCAVFDHRRSTKFASPNH